jgi:DNA mismatch repair protein MutL
MVASEPIGSSKTGTKMSIIKVLPDQLANKIAAGEVVQRPASALKELLENAVDAGADEIHVVVKDAGATLLQISDNGCGMSQEDALTCFLRHATSKIQSVEDLHRIRTLGFRGEALASIAAVAQVELRTKRHEDDKGVRIQINGGTFEPIEPFVCPNGTTFFIRNLFYNVPARRNFLKSPATEFKRIVEVFKWIALSHPQIAFSLKHDDKEIYRLSTISDKETSLKNRIADLFDKKPERLVPLLSEKDGLRLQGYIAKPEFSKRVRGEEFIFINGRYIKNNRLETAVMMGYGEMLPRGAYPFYVLFLELDPAKVDVNVHPTKTEVQFDDESGLFGLFRSATKQALGSFDITPFAAYDGEKMIEADAPQGTHLNPTDKLRTLSHFGGMRNKPLNPNQSNLFRPDKPKIDFEKAQQDLYGDISSEFSIQHSALQGTDDESQQPTSTPQSLNPSIPEQTDYQPTDKPASQPHSPDFWQIHNKYLFLENENGFTLIDQHAAHERIRYERILSAMEAEKGLSQQLLFPHTVHLDAVDYALAQELLADLERMGFVLSALSGNSIMISGIPADVPKGAEEEMLLELLEQYKTYRDELQLKSRDNLAKSYACRSAIRTGKKMSKAEVEALMIDLYACQMPYACPHGRPTMLHITTEELDKRFGRIGHLSR